MIGCEAHSGRIKMLFDFGAHDPAVAGTLDPRSIADADSPVSFAVVVEFLFAFF